jgi:hypothetical protein
LTNPGGSFNANLNIQAQKHYKIWGQQVKFRPGTMCWPQNIASSSQRVSEPQFNDLFYQIYYTEIAPAAPI